MQPITYSLIINLVALAIIGALAYAFNQPLMVIIAVLVQTHALERFQQQQMMLDDPDDEAQPMGFTAPIK